MAKAENVKCEYCGKNLGHMVYEGQETWEQFCSKKHADMYEEGKIYKPKFKRCLDTARTGKI